MTTTGATLEEEVITGPKPGEDSLATDLDNRREVTGDMLLGGHPNQELEEEETPAGGPEPKPGEEKPGEAKAKESEESPKQEEPPAGPRFKSQEEAEKAHGEAERRMTVATTEAADERRAREKLERELEELRLQQAKPPEAKEEKPVVAAPTNDERMAKIVEATKAANAVAVPKLRALDPDDPDYEQKYADIQTEITAALAKALLDVSISPASLTREEVEKIYQEKLDAGRQKDEATEAARVETKAREIGVKLGLTLDDPESADSIIWDKYKGKIPQEVFDKNSLEAQVEWVGAAVRKETGKEALTEAEKEEAARIAQENNQPLGRGGVKPKTLPKQTQEGSLADDFADARKQRLL